ncbi:hypothetical protein C4577_06590 [Candidatus Parcubacteria bacterium]|nr:MAG: hypothetical protein C4577_06590 [Candidatus Parcubacteria bacterium]
MAGHSWDVKKLFGPGKKLYEVGINAFKYMMLKTNNKNFDLALCMSGYMAERYRMTGQNNNFLGNPLLSDEANYNIWISFICSGFKFSKGKNADNYNRVGKRILIQYLSTIVHGTGKELLESYSQGNDCLFAIKDWLLDNEKPDIALLLVNKK